jgi:1-deoxy-D-xylulose-5-phosphate reductoisomerase
LDLAKVGRLDFENPRHEVFPALGLARQAATVGGTAPAVLNAANEVAVEEFLAGRVLFPRIWEIVAEVMAKIPMAPADDLASLLEADRAARELALFAASR